MRVDINRTLHRVVLTLALTLGQFGLSSCDDEGGDHILPPSFEQDEDSVDGSLSNLSGTVTIQGSAPANATISVGSATGHPDQTGRFFLPGLALENDMAWFRFNPQSSTFTCRPVHLTSGSEIHLPDVRLLKVDRYGVVFRNGAGGTVTVAGSWGSSATFADSSFTRNGAVFVGSCAPYVAVATADQTHFAAAFPGEFRGLRRDETEVPLDAVGVFWTSIVGQGPAYLDLAPGKTVTYRLGVDAAGGAPAPASVLVWTLDTTTGRWHEAGEAILAGNLYEVALPTLAPVCWANPTPVTCEVSGVVQDAAGQALANATVVYADQAGSTRQTAQSGLDGGFTMQVAPVAAAVVSAYFGSIVGRNVTINTVETCPMLLAEPLTVTLPQYQVDLTWTRGFGDLDGYLLVYVPDANDDLVQQWSIHYRNPGSADSAPFAWLETEARDGGDPETIKGRRWYDGQVQYWVHDYTHARTDSLRRSGARVDLQINDQNWAFVVAATAFDEATADTSGWWHVFDVQINGSEVTVATVDRFEAAPPTR